MKFEILLFDGFEEMDVFGVFEVLRMAGFGVRLVSLRPQSQLTGIYGARLIPDGVFDISSRPDVLIVPGGGWLTRAEKGAWAEAENGEILSKISECHKSGIVIASVCTGSLLLAKAGILKGRPATTNHAALKELEVLGAKVISARVVDDKDIITAGGITSSLDLGLWLVARFAGTEIASETSQKLDFELRGTVWKSP